MLYWFPILALCAVAFYVGVYVGAKQGRIHARRDVIETAQSALHEKAKDERESYRRLSYVELSRRYNRHEHDAFCFGIRRAAMELPRLLRSGE